MKSNHLLIFASLAITSTLYAQQPKFDFIQTQYVDGFSIVVSDFYWQTNSPINTDLIYGVWTTNKAWVDKVATPIPSHKYLCQIALADAIGQPVSKTPSGKIIGSKFDDFDLKSAHLYATAPPTPGPVLKWNPVKSEGTFSSSMILFKPSDIFRVTKPGRYVLKIRFQIVAFLPSPHGKTEKKLIRFPWLNYPLVKN